MSNMKWQQLVSHHDLIPHPEGGFYREVFRHPETVSAQESDADSTAASVATHILYLLPAGEVSRFHRLKEVEMWHFYHGSTLRLHLLENHRHHIIELSSALSSASPFYCVPPGTWFAAESAGDYSMVGCTVVPGFMFAHFEMASRTALLDAYPDFSDTIMKFTHPH